MKKTKFETIYLINENVENKENIINDVTQKIDFLECIEVENEIWGSRKLAYPISTKNGIQDKAYYVVASGITTDFKKFETELNNYYKELTENEIILKSIIVNAGEV